MSDPHDDKPPGAGITGKTALEDEPPDYTTMSGAEFQRAVGLDPEMWAEAFMQRVFPNMGVDKAEITAWFRDMINAAVRDAGIRVYKAIHEAQDG